MAIRFHEADEAGDPQVMTEINITALIDVMLVLLVMLIISIPVQLHAVNVEMPVGPPPPEFIEPVVLADIGVDPHCDIDDAASSNLTVVRKQRLD